MPVENPAAANTPEAPTPVAAPDPSNHQDLFAQALESVTTPAAPSEPAAGQPQPSSPQAASAAPAQPTFRELAAKAGLQTDQFQDDQQLVEALLNERLQLQPLANLGRQYAPHLSEFEQFLQSQRQSQQPGTPAQQPSDPDAFDPDKHFNEKWGAPAWDSRWDFFIDKGMLTRDENTGLLVPAQGYDAIVAPHIDKINEALERQSQKHRELFRGNPFKAIDEALKPVWERRFDEMFEKRFGAQQSQFQQQTAMQQFEQQYASVLFTKDTAGNVVPTPIGQKLGMHAERMMQRGYSEADAFYEAADMMGLTAQAPAPAGAQPALPATPAQASAQKVDSFLDQAKRNAAHQPNSAPYAPTPHNPAQPYVNSEVELANIWDTAASQAAS